MDIAYYISDLLGQQGEVTVPNLGYFVQIRMPAYYDSQLKKFFPPHFSVQFDPQVIDEDESLANHISAIKKISASSAKYFIEKYIGNLKNQAVVEDVNLENLGTFSSDGLKLTFQSAAKSNDPSFFAYPPVTVYKIGEEKTKAPEVSQPVTSQAKIVQPVTAAASEAFTDPGEKKPFTLFNPQPVKPAASAPVGAFPLNATAEDDDDIYEAEPKRLGIWIIVAIAFTVLIIALGALYKFKPDLFKFLKHKEITVAPKPLPIVVKKDSVADSLAKRAAAVKDSLRTDSVAKAAATPTTTKVEDKPVEVKKPDVAVNKTTGIPAEAKKIETATTKPTEKPVETPKKPDVIVASPPKSAPAVNTPVVTTPTNTASTDGLTKGEWVIHSFVNADKKPMEKRVEELKARGFANAHLEKENVKPGFNYKVMIGGSYKTKAEALDAAKELTAAGKLKMSELSIDQL